MLSFLSSFLTIPELLGFCINYPSVCKSYVLLYLMFSYIKYIREKKIKICSQQPLPLLS